MKHLCVAKAIWNITQDFWNDGDRVSKRVFPDLPLLLVLLRTLALGGAVGRGYPQPRRQSFRQYGQNR